MTRNGIAISLKIIYSILSIKWNDDRLFCYRFKEKYENAILRGNEKNASDRDKRVGSAVAKVILWSTLYVFKIHIFYSAYVVTVNFASVLLDMHV